MKKISCILSSLCLFALQLPLFAEAADAPPARPEITSWQTAIMLAISAVFFYFLFLRPDQKKQKAAEQQRNKLKKGDRVVAVGIIGTVLRVQENTLILKMYDDSKIEVLKGAVSEVLSEGPEDSKKETTKKLEKSESKKIDISDSDA